MTLDIELELEIYKEIYEILEDKVFIVRNKITGEVFIKKNLPLEKLEIYKRLQGLKDVNRAKIIKYFEDDSRLIVIEEFINGRNLENVLMNRDISEIEAIDIIIQVCKGLGELHNMEEPIIHRDIKPSNIMISNEGVIKIIDFDVSRIHNQDKNMDTTIMGTIGFAPQEQLGTGQTDTRSDIYSIGVLFNFLLLKRYPTDETPKGSLGVIIRKATQLDKNYRYKSLKEFIRALEFEKDKRDNGENRDKGITRYEKQKLEGDDEAKKGTIKSILEFIPGFSGNILVIIFSICWYGFALCGVVVWIQTKNIQNLNLVAWMVVPPFIIQRDILHINKYLPLINSEKIYIRLIGKVIYWFVISVIILLPMEIK